MRLSELFPSTPTLSAISSIPFRFLLSISIFSSPYLSISLAIQYHLSSRLSCLRFNYLPFVFAVAAARVSYGHCSSSLHLWLDLLLQGIPHTTLLPLHLRNCDESGVKMMAAPVHVFIGDMHEYEDVLVEDFLC